MSYDLKFIPTALKEWKKLDSSIQQMFKKKLEERLENPHAPSAKLSGFPNLYKIKLLSAGYRLVYEVNDNEIFILVIVVGKRNNDDV
ncbi:MAG TPA: type II toxin-antitoxin system RelE/ParE family toxin, partial [bacterium]|nr:type II toxin-antitoxin system RelE/ParE family toxin [bacterium]